ncbi:hypothetical protein [Mycobacterium sp.]|nr:hypothetical protein [Mycobacterium sp.]
MAEVGHKPTESIALTQYRVVSLPLRRGPNRAFAYRITDSNVDRLDE